MVFPITSILCCWKYCLLIFQMLFFIRYFHKRSWFFIQAQIYSPLKNFKFFMAMYNVQCIEQPSTVVVLKKCELYRNGGQKLRWESNRSFFKAACICVFRSYLYVCYTHYYIHDKTSTVLHTCQVWPLTLFDTWTICLWAK